MAVWFHNGLSWLKERAKGANLSGILRQFLESQVNNGLVHQPCSSQFELSDSFYRQLEVEEVGDLGVKYWTGFIWVIG